jgi:hypothetical protein
MTIQYDKELLKMILLYLFYLDVYNMIKKMNSMSHSSFYISIYNRARLVAHSDLLLKD